MNDIELRKLLAYNIKRCRKFLNITQEKLAELVDLSVQTIADIESCRTWVSDKTLVKIANNLNTTVSDLFREKSSNEKQKEINIIEIKNSLKEEIISKIDLAFHKLNS